MTRPPSEPVLLIVVAVWAFTQVFGAFVSEYHVPEGLNQLVLTICGFLYGHRVGRRQGKESEP